MHEMHNMSLSLEKSQITDIGQIAQDSKCEDGRVRF